MNRAISMWKSREAGGCAISIETQAYCNHLCRVCPRNLDPTRSRWNPDGSPIMDRMPTVMVLNLIDQAVDMGWQGPIHFSHYSEPLIDDRFSEFCRYAVSKGLKPELFTNGSLLTPELVSTLDGLVPYIVISFDSPGSQEYWQRKFKKSKVRITKAYQVLIWSQRKDLLIVAVDKAKGKSCTGPPMVAFRINYDGQMSMCYADFNNEFGLLNARDHGLEELWFGDEHVRAIAEMSKPGSRARRKLCSGCPQVYPDGGTYVKVDRLPMPPMGWFE